MFDNFVQIKTGEGKSVTLAVVSIIFALFGYDVSSACYSQYLSQRDYNDFKDIFDKLNITSKIFYGTFNQICERFINKDGSIRDMILNRVLINHEKIHTKQQSEMFLVFFYLWYLIEYLIRIIQYKEVRKAYRNISFEREAYSNERNLKYLEHRKPFSFIQYCTL